MSQDPNFVAIKTSSFKLKMAKTENKNKTTTINKIKIKIIITMIITRERQDCWRRRLIVLFG